MAKAYWQDEDVTLYLGKCEDVLPSLPENSVDAIVTDPPAAIAFMGRAWDSDLGGRDRWTAWLAGCMTAAARVLKPGGHLLVWSLPRTSHWTAWALEDAGLEIRDCVLHLFGSGFPKSLNVSVAIDKLKRRDYVAAALRLGMEIPGRNLDDWTKEDHSPGDRWWEEFKQHLSAEQWGAIEREVVGSGKSGAASVAYVRDAASEYDVTAAATADAVRWAGFGTALKPGQEMWWLARKPLAAGTVAGNVLQYGTGALNIDGCRVGYEPADLAARTARTGSHAGEVYGHGGTVRYSGGEVAAPNDAGRWPTNILLTHSPDCEPIGTRVVRPSAHGPSRGSGVSKGYHGDIPREHHGAGHPETVEAWDCAPGCPVAELDRQSGVLTSSLRGKPYRTPATNQVYGDLGTSPANPGNTYGDVGGASRFYPVFKYQAKAPAHERPRLEDGSAHETVKPLGLVCWLVKLITQPGGTVLDMFAGSGPVGEACIIEGFRCILIEQDPKSAELIKVRLSKPIQPTLFGDVA